MLKLLLKLIIYSVLMSLNSLALTYYVDPNGSDISGNGTQNSPWASLSYACSQVNNSGDIIHLNSGIYIETAVCHLEVGVSIEGPVVDYNYPSFYNSPTAVVRGWNGADPVIKLESTNEGTDGQNQEIRYIRFEGNNKTVTSAVWVYKRKNVIIRNSEFVDMLDRAVKISGSGTWQVPVIYATGIKIFDSKFVDNSRLVNWASGTIEIGGTEGAEIFNVYIDCLDRSGFGIKYCSISRAANDAGEINNKGILIHDSEFHMNPTERWGFAIELWGTYDDSKIYNNTIEGTVNFDMIGKGNGQYGVHVFNNVIYNSGSISLNNGIALDRAIDGLLVRDNFIYNRRKGFYTGNAPNMVVQNIDIYRNVFYNLGANSFHPEWTAHIDFGEDENYQLRNIKIYNNVFDGENTYLGIKFIQRGTANNIEIKNNVFHKIQHSSIMQNASAGNIDNITITNNYYYNTGGNFSIWDGNVSNKIEHSNTNVSADFVNSGLRPTPYYQLVDSSANVVDSGTNVGLPYSGSTPDIGTFEFSFSQITSPSVTGNLRIIK